MGRTESLKQIRSDLLPGHLWSFPVVDELVLGSHPSDEVVQKCLLVPASGVGPVLPPPGRHCPPAARGPPVRQREQRQRRGDRREGQLLWGLPGGLEGP